MSNKVVAVGKDLGQRGYYAAKTKIPKFSFNCTSITLSSFSRENVCSETDSPWDNVIAIAPSLLLLYLFLLHF
jgi:hypothetical protein